MTTSPSRLIKTVCSGLPPLTALGSRSTFPVLAVPAVIGFDAIPDYWLPVTASRGLVDVVSASTGQCLYRACTFLERRGNSLGTC